MQAKKVKVSLSLDQKLLQQLKMRAAAEERSLSGLINRLLKEQLNQPKHQCGPHRPQ